ncbi:helix-turn-helix domain-containing protein [Halomonas sp. V046]|uniref:helix-turn-helix domain-containing protein n=1 Tax=Halomonas sp. V046 TaxID=3459611 RepID=UPI004043CAF2
MSDTQNSDFDALSPQASPGDALKRERESQGLSREEVGAALNLRAAVIEGLENDSYEQVPVVTYRRGYLRSYAQLLGMDPKQVIELYEAQMGHEEVERKVTPVYINKPPSRIGAWLFRLMTLVVIAGLIGLTLMWWQSRGGSQPPEVSDNGPVSVDNIDGSSAVAENAGDADNLPPVPETGSDMGLVDGEGSQGASAMSGGEDAASEGDDRPVTVAAADAAARQAEAEAAEQPTPDATETEAEASADDDAAAQAEATAAANSDARVLKLTFNEQSWTQIFDSTNTRVFVGLQQAGTEATVEGEPPFQMTVGNATGVELTWRGESVDLRSRAGANNVARFTLGE